MSDNTYNAVLLANADGTAKEYGNTEKEKPDGYVILSTNSVKLNLNNPTADIEIISASGDVTVSSSDTDVATVSRDGNIITVSLVDSGTAIITVDVAETPTNKAIFTAVEVTARTYTVMTVKLDFNDSNPDTWATYEDDAVGMTVGSSKWDNFFGIYECMLLNGVEGQKLNPNNLAQHLDGTSADITSGSEGDVMTKFPIRGWKVTKGGTNNKVVTISLTDDPDKSGYCYKAHYYKGQKCSAFYRGCYKGYVTSSKLRSLSGKTPTVSTTIGTFRTYAQNNGTGYEQSTYYTTTLLQIMYTLKYKGRNAQIAIGRGYVDGNSSRISTGGTNSKGRDYGETTGKYQMCFLNQEDFYGNCWDMTDGLVTDSGRNYLVCDTTQNISFNDDGTNYINVGGGWSSNIYGYISSIIGTNDAPFLCDDFNGSETTYLCDTAFAFISCIPIFGSGYTHGSESGIFGWLIANLKSGSFSDTSTRLTYFKVA